jgi:hypothetical protein
VALNYIAPPECPDERGYASHVRSRSATLSFEPSGGVPSADSVDVRVEPGPTGSGWVGQVNIAGTLALEREVKGERCEDVVAALALITVLRLEGASSSSAGVPGSGVSGSAPPGSSSVAGSAAPGSAAASSSPAGSGANASTASTPPGASNGPPSSADAPRAPSDSSERQTSAEPSDLATRGASPDESNAAPPVVPAAPARVLPEAPLAEPSGAPGSAERRASSAHRDEVASEDSDAARGSERRTRSTDESEIAASSEADDAGVDSSEPAPPSQPWQWPSVHAGVALQAGYATVPSGALRGLAQAELRLGEHMSSWAGTLSLAYAHGAGDVQAAQLSVTLLTAELGLCPPAFIDTGGVWVRACALARTGVAHVLITPDDESLRPGDVWRPWVALGPSLQLGVPLSQRWVLRGAFELALQLIRDRFDVLRTGGDAADAERVTLYRPEAVSFELGLGLSYNF